MSRDQVILLGGAAIAALTYATVGAAMYLGGGRAALRRQWRTLLLTGLAVAILGAIMWTAGPALDAVLGPLIMLPSLGAVVLFALRRRESDKLADEERERRRERVRALRGRIALLVATYVLGLAIITFLTLGAAGSQ